MKVKCPYCGKNNDVSDVNIGDTVRCDCGQNFTAKIFAISSSVFVDGNAQIACPYCGETLEIPESAINRKVQCGSCLEKFRLIIQGNPVPQNKADSDIPKRPACKRRLKPNNSNSIANSILAEQANKKNIDPAIAGSIIAGIIFSFLLFVICYVASNVPESDGTKKEEVSYDTHRDLSPYGKIKKGKIYLYEGNPPLYIKKVINGGLFGKEGVIVLRHNYDYSGTFFFIEMNTAGLISNDKLSRMTLKENGTYIHNGWSLQSFKKVK